jgi:hypothetical protein
MAGLARLSSTSTICLKAFKTNHSNVTLPFSLAIQLGGHGDVLIDYVSICLTGLLRSLP